MKSLSSFVCQECGYDSPQWLGKCPECGSWNSLKEFQSNIKLTTKNSKLTSVKNIEPKKLSDISSSKEIQKRIATGFSELDGVLGGGIVKGSVMLLAGDPGVGKSTLLLQTALNIASLHSSKKTVLYVSGEESEEQVKLRSQRISKVSKLNNFLIASSTDTDSIASLIEEKKPDFVIIDSIQTMESENLTGLSGSVGQVRFAAFSFIKLAKTLNIPVVLVGHVTKEGMVAGPMVLSHMVDTVLFLEGDKTTGTRILRSFKNRFGPVDEVGIFAMEGDGMAEVKNPESLFLSETKEKTAGNVLVATLEGTRAFLVELQALVVYSKFPIPKRVVSGVDRARVELLIAVLQKHVRLPLETYDVFVNVPGGLKLSDRACDLGICLAIFSSLKNIALGNRVCISEIGLLGELRTVSNLEKRVKQAKKLGYNKVVSSKEYRNIGQVIGSLNR